MAGPCRVAVPFPVETPFRAAAPYPAGTPFQVEVRFPVAAPSPVGALSLVETQCLVVAPFPVETLSRVAVPSQEGAPYPAGMTFPSGATSRKASWLPVAAGSAGNVSCRTSASSRYRLGRCYSARGVRRRMPVSRSCSAETSPGASVNGSCADWVFGKAITSRMLSAPVISMTIRSRP